MRDFLHLVLSNHQTRKPANLAPASRPADQWVRQGATVRPPARGAAHRRTSARRLARPATVSERRSLTSWAAGLEYELVRTGFCSQHDAGTFAFGALSRWPAACVSSRRRSPVSSGCCFQNKIKPTC